MHPGISNEGVFYAEDDDFIQGFDRFSVAYYIPHNQINWYLKTDVPDDKKTMTFNINNSSTQNVYLSIDTWNHRMYPEDCSSDSFSTIKLDLYRGDKNIGHRYYLD